MLNQIKSMLFVVTVVFSLTADSLSTLLFFRPDGEIFDQTVLSMQNEFEGAFDMEQMLISKETSPIEIRQKLQTCSPRAVVLMGNRAIWLYSRFVHENKEKENIPVVALLASQVSAAVKSLGSVNGIEYETPMVTALVRFRNVIGKPVNSVGVVYRDVFKDFVETHTVYCNREKITVKSIMIDNREKNYRKELNKKIKQLIVTEHVDAFWIPNDNKLLTPELLQAVWIPLFIKYKIPVIVGVESLVNPEMNFGTFAVIPEPAGMGTQAAQLIFDLEQSGWSFGANRIFPAISVYSVLNAEKFTYAEMNRLNLKEVSKVVQLKK